MTTTMIHTGHAIALHDLTRHYNDKCHSGARRSFLVHCADMKAGEHYQIPAPELDEGRCAFAVEDTDGDLFYHEGKDVISFVPHADIVACYGTWSVLPDSAVKLH